MSQELKKPIRKQRTKNAVTLVPHDNRSSSIELLSDQMDELIFRLERAKQPFKQYMHKSIQMGKDWNLTEESESRIIILDTFDSFKVLNMILNDTLPIVIEHNLFEICIYENILVDERPNVFHKIDRFKNGLKNGLKHLLDQRKGFRWLFHTAQNTLTIGTGSVSKVYILSK
jgi:hypothetical protein